MTLLLPGLDREAFSALLTRLKHLHATAVEHPQTGAGLNAGTWLDTDDPCIFVRACPDGKIRKFATVNTNRMAVLPAGKLNPLRFQAVNAAGKVSEKLMPQRTYTTPNEVRVLQPKGLKDPMFSCFSKRRKQSSGDSSSVSGHRYAV